MLYRIRSIEWQVNPSPIDMPDDQTIKQIIPAGNGLYHASSMLRINNNVFKETGKEVRK